MIYDVNKNALKALRKGDFDECQKLLRCNCKSGDYRAFHNLGYFYYENGVILKNKKIISGSTLGKYYVEKANQIFENILSTKFLAQYAFEDEHNTEKALILYKKALKMQDNRKIKYNIASCLYMEKKYNEVFDYITDDCLNSFDEEVFLYCFSMLHIDRRNFLLFMKKNNILALDSRNIDWIILLMYFYDITKLPDTIIDYYITNWDPDDYMLAVIIDILIKKNKNITPIKELIEKRDSYYQCNRKYDKIMHSCLSSSTFRVEFINSLDFYKPQIQKECCFWGCEKHHINW